MLPRLPSPAPVLVRFSLLVARAVARTSTSLSLLLAVSVSAGTRNFDASRIRPVCLASFGFIGAAATEQSRCYGSLLGEGYRPKGNRMHFFSSASDGNMQSAAGNFIPNESAVTKEMESPLQVGDERDRVKADREGQVSDEAVAEDFSLSRVRGNIHKHFVFLVHGWLGNEMEMSYIEDALDKAMSSSWHGEDDETVIVVHKVTCNNGKTADGIAAGGSRLADEMVETVRGHMAQHDHRSSSQGIEGGAESEESADDLHHVSFSVVGNSLGGLYARYALSVLPTQLGNVVLHPNVFCTTATPHLGVASNTYVPIPRVAERVIGRGMGRTGRDLFRLDPVEGEDRDLIYRMSTEEAFLEPLSKFAKRVAYANAFRTDFQVPTDTAAFLSPLSAYPHRLDRTLQEEFVATILHTESHDWRKFDTVFREPSMEHDILTMSTKLDSLGWTKVFVDVRQRIPMPSVPLPGMRRRDSRSELKQFVAERRESGAFNESGILVESRELVTLMNPTERLHFPLGHSVMVANAKSEWYAKLNEQGRPVMDKLASELVQDMLRFGSVGNEEDFF